MMHKPLHIILTLLFFILVPFPASAIEDEKAHIHMDKTTFEESITKLGEIFDMEITLQGISNLPQNKFKLNLEQATFEEAVKEAMRKVGLQNYVLVLNQQKKPARIWFLPACTTDAISSLEIDNNMKTITPKQFEKLEAAESENLRMMTLEEFAQLEPDSENNFRSMTPEKFENLEPAESENCRMMTPEEYARLKPESEENYRGMTPEEFSKLKKAL